jgi:hypothetical protein
LIYVKAPATDCERAVTASTACWEAACPPIGSSRDALDHSEAACLDKHDVEISKKFWRRKADEWTIEEQQVSWLLIGWGTPKPPIVGR